MDLRYDLRRVGNGEAAGEAADAARTERSITRLASARIDVASGATCTSEAYAASLQAA